MLFTEIESAPFINQAKEILRQQFPTYDDAIAELVRLRMDATIKSVKLEPIKRPRGRPKNIEAFGCVISSKGKITYKAKKERGRPYKHTLQEMREILLRIERFKDIAEVSLSSRKRPLDRQIIKGLIHANPKCSELKNLRKDKQEAIVKRITKEVKYYRDQTGIRQRKKSR